MIEIEAFGFLGWWNDQTVEMQQDWLLRHTDDRNRAVAIANLKIRKSIKPKGDK